MSFSSFILKYLHKGPYAVLPTTLRILSLSSTFNNFDFLLDASLSTLEITLVLEISITSLLEY